MVNFLKSLFSNKNEDENTNGKDKTAQKNFDILKYDGIRAQRMGRIDYAIKCFDSALKIEEDFEVMNYLSQLYIGTEKYDEAKLLLEKMIEKEPSIITSYLTLSNLFFIQEAYTEMIEVLEKGISVEANNPNVHYLMAKAKKSLKQHNEAIDHLTQAINNKEDLIEPFLMRAEIYMDLGQYVEAIDDIEKVLKLQEEEEHALLLRGKLHELTDKPEDAEKDYVLVTELNPFHDKAFINLAQLYIKQEKYTEAVQLCDEAIDFNATSAGLYNERAKAKLALNDNEGAESDKQTAEKLISEHAAENAAKPEVKEKQEINSLGLPSF